MHFHGIHLPQLNKRASVSLVLLLKTVRGSRKGSEYSFASLAFVPDSHFRVKVPCWSLRCRQLSNSIQTVGLTNLLASHAIPHLLDWLQLQGWSEHLLVFGARCPPGLSVSFALLQEGEEEVSLITRPCTLILFLSRELAPPPLGGQFLTVRVLPFRLQTVILVLTPKLASDSGKVLPD